ncbi:hypothetical protein [Halorussus marinus]|uniref:hypothetical protein n=1 Tax=Halorussus marinus TaxID=2505976 RepID=UPI00109200D5|nr:hypothetical protein [Halorussus marinus]
MTGQTRSTDSSGTDGESLGVSVPDEHVGAFVAEAFEDVERDTTWKEVVGALVAEEARDAWADLSRTEQAVEVLAAAADYDERAVELLAEVPTDRGEPTSEIRDRYEEALRCRHNADRFRDGIAAAYADGYLADDQLVAAVEAFGFDTALIAEREDELDTVANTYEFEFRPYGGTLMTDDEGDDQTMDGFEAW